MKLFLKNLLFTILVPGSVAVVLPLLIAEGEPVLDGRYFVPSLALFVLGGAIYTWCVVDFASFGRATPAPIDAPRKLVVRGLYRFVRNPMYLGVLTFACGWAVLFRELNLVLYVALVGGAFQVFILFYEEPHLKRQFGHEYAAYLRKVRRWVPRWPRNDTSIR